MGPRQTLYFCHNRWGASAGKWQIREKGRICATCHRSQESVASERAVRTSWPTSPRILLSPVQVKGLFVVQASKGADEEKINRDGWVVGACDSVSSYSIARQHGRQWQLYFQGEERMDGGRHEAYAGAVNTYGEAGWCTKREEARGVEANSVLGGYWRTVNVRALREEEKERSDWPPGTVFDVNELYTARK